MSDTAAAAHLYHDSTRYWKMCTIVLGIGFVIAVASHGGPSTASADTANQLTKYQSQSALMAQQALSVGGFDTVDGEPAFVIVNQDGQRVGTLPMANSTNSTSTTTALDD